MKITVQNQTIRVTSADILVAGTVNVYEVEFDFDAAWEGYTLMAVFEGRAGGRAESREAVIDGGKAVIPWETLLPNGYLRIGVYGVRDSQRLPTIYTERLPVQRGAEQAEPSAEPTPGVIEQILIQTAADRTAAAESAAAAEQARQGAETAKQSALTAQSGAETAKSGAERAKNLAEAATGRAETAAVNAEQALSAAVQARDAAVQEADRAAAAANGASESENNAQTHASNAAQFAAQASAARDEAQQSANVAETARSGAEAAQQGAEAAKEAAELAKTAAETAANNASNSAAEALTAKNEAESAQNAAAGSANAAQNSKNAATQSAEAANTAKTAAQEAAGAAQQAAENAAQSAAAAAESAETLSGAIADIAQLKSDIVQKADKTALAKTDRSLDALWKLNQGITYEFQTDDAETYQKTVPSGAKLANVNSIGGKTVVWNQLAESNATGVVPVSGRKIASFIGGTWEIVVSGGSEIAVSGGTDMVFDLTTMFGAGNEPETTDDPRIAWIEQYATKHPEYNAGELVSADVESVAERGRNLFDRNDYLILGGYFNNGKIISNSLPDRGIVYLKCKGGATYTISRLALLTNERFAVACTKEQPKAGIDIYNTKSAANAQTVGSKMQLTITTPEDAMYLVCWAYWFSRVEALDSLQIEPGSEATPYVPYHLNTYPIPATVRNLTGYGWSAGAVYNGIERTETGWQYVQRVGSRDYQDGDTVTDGTITYYELGAPIITDITELMENALDAITVETGGTLTFENAAQLPVPNSVEYAVKLSEVIQS